jgi:Dolichyl-phosphate-mannose-protein mannosyltransferase
VSEQTIEKSRGDNTDTEPATTWAVARRDGFIAFVVSRFLVLVGAAAASAGRASAVAQYPELGLTKPKSALSGIVDALTSWDGKWYFEIVRQGYPHAVPPRITYDQIEARAAFFPLFPWLIRAVDKVLPGSSVTAGIMLNAVLGLVFVLLVGKLAMAWFDDARVAMRAMVIAAFFPGSYVLSITYSEALLLCLAAAGLLALHRRRWVVAGVLSLLATATRPNGIAMVVACAAAAFVAIRARREWRALAAPVLAPIGFVAVQFYIGTTAHERNVWFRVQREAWQEGTSFGATALTNIGKFLFHPLSSPTNAITTASVVCVVVGLIALRKAKLPIEAVVFSLTIIALMLLPATVTARPRFVYTAFPLAIAAARAWPLRWRTGHTGDEVWSMFLTVCGGGLVALMTIYGLYAVAIP